MDGRRIELLLPEELARAVERIAREADITPGQVMRDLVAREVARRARARPPVRADERLVAPLRARLAGDLAHASGWADLQSRLKPKGYVLREAGGGLALHDWPGDRRICKASELGFSYGRLLRRFDAPFPGHAHTSMHDMLRADRGGSRPRSAIDDDDDPVLVEPFD